VPYEFEYDGQKTTTTLAVTAVSVEKGAIADLKDFKLDTEEKASDPYYVTMKYRNIGKTADLTLSCAPGVGGALGHRVGQVVINWPVVAYGLI
jgi:hypothetical protein